MISLVRLLFKRSRRSATRQLLFSAVVFVASSYLNSYLYLAFGFASPEELKHAVEVAKAKEAGDKAKAAEAEKQAKIADECANTLDAFIMSQDFVKRNLKAPSTAEFPRMSDTGVNVSVKPKCAFRVVGWVDAQNGFGAQIRSVYVVDMTRNTENDTWYLTDIAINGR